MSLLIENKGQIRILTLNRPEKRNALNGELTQTLLKELRVADAEDAVDAIVLTGAGPGFCAGADLAEFRDLHDPQAAEARAELTMQLHLVFSKMTTPVVTAINGAAMGGGTTLYIAGDLAVMAESATLAYPETKTASSPRSCSATWCARSGARRVRAGRSPASRSTRHGTARSLGLVNNVFPQWIDGRSFADG
jgi:enoyl-CoA hydratase/carnithine racemase